MGDKLDKICGIYIIRNIQNSKIYIGSSIDINGRWQDHKKELRGNYHNNKRLQNSWNKYKEESFTFEIIEQCEKEDLISREQFWIDYYKSYDKSVGFNILPIAESRLGMKHSNETKEKMSESRKGENHWNYGKCHSEKTKQKISNSHKGKTYSDETKKKLSEIRKGKPRLDLKGVKQSEDTIRKRIEKNKIVLRGEGNPMAKLTEEDVKNIRVLIQENIPLSEIANQYNVDYKTIYNIRNKKSWKHVN